MAQADQPAAQCATDHDAAAVHSAYEGVRSLWEIAHRWHGYHPDETNPAALPLPVQDTLRALTHDVWRHELAACSPDGVVFKTADRLVDFDTYVAQQLDRAEDPEDAETIASAEDAYDEHVARFLRRQNEAAEGLEACFQERRFDRRKLESVRVTRGTLRAYCEARYFPLPGFWFAAEPYTRPERDDPADAPARAPREGDIDRIACQAVAVTLWRLYPEASRQEIIRHRSLRGDAGGRNYRVRTLDDWLKEVDPRPEAEKAGRPRKDRTQVPPDEHLVEKLTD